MTSGTYIIIAVCKYRLVLRVAHAKTFQINIQLDQKRFGQRILSLQGVHGGEEKSERISSLAVIWSALQILDENACCNVQAERYERIHLKWLDLDKYILGGTYCRQVHVRNHAHDARNFVSRRDTSYFTLRADGSRKAVFVSLVNRSLVQANCRGMNIHIREHDVRVGQTIWQFEM